MPRYPSVEVAIDALQARNEALERLVTEQAEELDRARTEAKVDAILDRVRVQAFGLQHTDETVEIAVAVFDALRELDVPVLQVGLIGDLNAETRDAAVWVAGVDASGAPRASRFQTTLAGHPLLDDVFGAVRTGTRLVRGMDAAAFEAYLRAFLGRYPASYADRVVARAPRAGAYHYVYAPTATRQKGHVYALLSEAPSDDVLHLLGQFSVLFNLAYVRYRELQQAEAHARASKTDAALERVRAKALAMRRSDDLSEVVEAVLRELGGLGVLAVRSGVGVVDGPARRMETWTLTAQRRTLTDTVALEGHPLLDALFDAWRQQKDLSYILEGGGLGAYYRALEQNGVSTVRPTAGAPAEGAREYVHVVPFAAGVLFAFAQRPFSEDTVQVMQRLAGAFHLAYTRHLDLQQAEIQAREVAQQASVHRVRAEIASMRTVGDLDRITPLMWQELTSLGVPFVRCGVFIVDEAERAVQAFLATPEGNPLGSVRLPFGAHPLLDRVVDHWRRQSALTDLWAEAETTAWARALGAHGLDGSLGAQPASMALHFAPFAQGMLYVGSPDPLAPEDGDAAQALADAFEVAYARYDDFQRLDAQKREVEGTLAELRAAQQQLVQSEKLASLGQLTAGIAHEIKNPLNFVNNFAALSRELAAELAAELEAGADPGLVRELLDDLQSNAEKIERHGRRADSIVRGMMQHARGGEGHREAVDLNTLVEEHLNLAYHGRRAHVPDFDVTTERDYGTDVGEVEVVPQEIGRVLINLINNAFDAVSTRAATEGPAFTPTVRVGTARTPDGVEVRIEDNGTGIPPDVRTRVFEPFFTTKPAGAGTGLGLSMSHDIVEQGHGGRLRVETAAGRGATFVVSLPR